MVPYPNASAEWDRAEELLVSGKIIERTVSSYNTRGLVVRFGKLQGFVPIAEISSRPPTKSQEAGQIQSTTSDWMSTMVDAKLRLKVIEADRMARRLVFSERRAIR